MLTAAQRKNAKRASRRATARTPEAQAAKKAADEARVAKEQAERGKAAAARESTDYHIRFKQQKEREQQQQQQQQQVRATHAAGSSDTHTPPASPFSDCGFDVLESIFSHLAILAPQVMLTAAPHVCTAWRERCATLPAVRLDFSWSVRRRRAFYGSQFRNLVTEKAINQLVRVRFPSATVTAADLRYARSVRDNTLLRLLAKNPQLEELWLTGCRLISDSAVREIQQSCTGLRADSTLGSSGQSSWGEEREREGGQAVIILHPVLRDVPHGHQ
jgi:hypothetical protein